MLGSLDENAPLSLVFYYGAQGVVALVIAIVYFVRKGHIFSNTMIQFVLLTITLCAPLVALVGVPAVGILGACMGGVGLVWSYAISMDSYSRIAPGRALMYFLLSVVIAALIRTPLEFLGGLYPLLLAFPLPILCFVGWRIIRARTHPPDFAFENGFKKERFTIALLLILVAYGLSLGLIRVPADFSNGEMLTPAVYLVFKFTLPLALLIVFRKERWQGSIESACQIALAIVLTSLIFISFFLGEASVFTAAASTSARTTVTVFLWIALIGYAFVGPFNLVYYYCCCWGSYMIATSLGVYMGYHLQLDPRLLILGLVYLLVMITLIALFFIKKHNAKLANEDEGLIGSNAKFAQKLNDLKGEYGLTSREMEILEFIIKGRSKRYIAETLIISENTVKAHAKSLYMKMGVHSRQQLLSLFGID